MQAHTKQVLIAALIAFALTEGASAQPWRSAHYPDNWTPGTRDSQGRFLHDFSYAGYRRGEAPIPAAPPGPVVDVTAAPFSADPSGVTDTTRAIQDAIDHVQSQGGGVVYLPPGVYRVRPQLPTDMSALRISKSNVVLRGAGPGQTFVFNDTTEMRLKSVIRASPRDDVDLQWVWNRNPVTHLAGDLPATSTVIPVQSVAGLRVGQWIVLKADPTPAFIAEHNMTGIWDQSLGGLCFYRKIVARNRQAKTITVDVPTRYPLKARDFARVYKMEAHLEEVGLEGFSIGMRSVDARLDGKKYNTPNTREYRIHAANALKLNHVVNGWVRNIQSYEPPGNRRIRWWSSRRFHLLSTGVVLTASRNVTVESVVIKQLQNKGHGGNGYGFVVQGSDNLITKCTARETRHNYTFGSLWASGNVVSDCSARYSDLPMDFHMQLSPANLVELVVFHRDELSAVPRDHVPGHGHATTQSVFWNNTGRVESNQHGWGYVIGNNGRVDTPTGYDGQRDWVEGTNGGGNLVPRSLYRDQLRRRLGTP